MLLIVEMGSAAAPHSTEYCSPGTKRQRLVLPAGSRPLHLNCLGSAGTRLNDYHRVLRKLESIPRAIDRVNCEESRATWRNLSARGRDPEAGV